MGNINSNESLKEEKVDKKKIEDIPNTHIPRRKEKREYSEEYERILRKEHHNEGKYRNIGDTWFELNYKDFVTLNVRDGFHTKIRELTSEENLRDIDKRLPYKESECDRYSEKKEDIQVTWIGHSTFLIRHQGVTIITDPVFSKRASYFSNYGPGPARYRNIPEELEIEQISPKIDIVLISHNHYDHMEETSIKRIYKHHNSLFLVPLGEKFRLESMGIPKENIVELDWFESYKYSNIITLDFVPAQHWSLRTGLDKYNSLWGGWVIQSSTSIQTRKIWFTGDTGFSHIFSDIGLRYGSFDLSLIPIGAYGDKDTRWFLRNQHIDVSEAIQIAYDTNSISSIGCHFGTFCLTPEPLDEPSIVLSKIVSSLNENPRFFETMCHGETRIY